MLGHTHTQMSVQSTTGLARQEVGQLALTMMRWGGGIGVYYNTGIGGDDGGVCVCVCVCGGMVCVCVCWVEWGGHNDHLTDTHTLYKETDRTEWEL